MQIFYSLNFKLQKDAIFLHLDYNNCLGVWMFEIFKGAEGHLKERRKS